MDRHLNCQHSHSSLTTLKLVDFSIDPSNGQDQLAECMERGLCFEDFDEQKICFMPTYKFNPNSRIYDTSRTLRQPSFTVSRIMWENMNVLTCVCLLRIEFYREVEDQHAAVFSMIRSTSSRILIIDPFLPFTKFKSNRQSHAMHRKFAICRRCNFNAHFQRKLLSLLYLVQGGHKISVWCPVVSYVHTT